MCHNSTHPPVEAGSASEAMEKRIPRSCKRDLPIVSIVTTGIWRENTYRAAAGAKVTPTRPIVPVLLGADRMATCSA